MEDRSRAVGVGIRQFHQRFPAENVQGLSRAPLTAAIASAFTLAMFVVILFS